MRKQLSSNHTIYASYIGYVTQAIVNNYAPLLFVTFMTQFQIPLSQITLITGFNFVIQFCIDAFSTPIVNRLGMKKSIILAHLCAFIGFIGLATLPFILPHFIGIMISIIFTAIGGGFIEVLISPIVEGCPSENKEKAMSLLHSFYCWGYLGVILVSTLFFTVFGTNHWNILALLFSLVPLCNAIYFSFVPIYPVVEESLQELSAKELLSNHVFWLLVILMVCAGASEMGMSQWSSSFMESALNLSKSMGDLLGPASFALFMGIARALYGKKGDKMPLKSFMIACGILCIFCYLFAGFSSIQLLALFSCALCGFSIGIFWPGTFSIAAKKLPAGGIRMYAYLALAGDLGCCLGTSSVGALATIFNNNIRYGLGMMFLFPLILIITILILYHRRTGENTNG